MSPDKECKEFLNACVYYDVEYGLSCENPYGTIWIAGPLAMHYCFQLCSNYAHKKCSSSNNAGIVSEMLEEDQMLDQLLIMKM